MQSGAIARFGGITAYGDEFHGTGFHFVDLDGWTETPDVSMQQIKRPEGDGMFPTPAFLEDRVVSLSGFYVASSQHELEHESARLRGLIKRRLRLVIEDARGTFWADGTVTRASFANFGFIPEGNWAVEFTCDNPHVYGPVNEFTAGEVAIHRGNSPAWPTFVITGTSAGGYTITGPNGQRIVVTTALASGTPHTIDTSEGEVMVGSTLGNVSVFEPWTIGPGLPGVTHTISAGSLLVKVPDTY